MKLYSYNLKKMVNIANYDIDISRKRYDCVTRCNDSIITSLA